MNLGMGVLFSKSENVLYIFLSIVQKRNIEITLISIKLVGFKFRVGAILLVCLPLGGFFSPPPLVSKDAAREMESKAFYGCSPLPLYCRVITGIC